MTYTARFETKGCIPAGVTCQGEGLSPYAAVVSLLRLAQAEHGVRQLFEVRAIIADEEGETWGYARVHKMVPMRFTLLPLPQAQGDVAASIPEPPPQPKGIEVTPQIIAWLECHGNPASIQLVRARDAFGRAKYGQGLMTGDGRDTFNDLSDELGDAQQYAFKGLLNGDLTRAQIDTLKAYTTDLLGILDSVDTRDKP